MSLKYGSTRIYGVLFSLAALAGCSLVDQVGIGKLRTLGIKTVAGGISISVRAKWREGQVMYLVSLSPPDSVRAMFAHQVLPMEAPRPDSGGLVPYAVAVLLIDRDGFTVDTVRVNKEDLVEEWGKAFTVRGQRPMSSTAYRSVTGWTPLIWWGWERSPQAIRAPSNGNPREATASARK